MIISIAIIVAVVIVIISIAIVISIIVVVIVIIIIVIVIIMTIVFPVRKCRDLVADCVVRRSSRWQLFCTIIIIIVAVIFNFQSKIRINSRDSKSI